MAIPKKRSQASYSPMERFWTKVRWDGECFIWTGYKDKDGYGRFNPGKPNRGNHKASRWLLQQLLDDPLDGLVVAHSCDNPSCVTPGHLWAMPQGDNIRDGVERGRPIGRHYTPRNRDSEGRFASASPV